MSSDITSAITVAVGNETLREQLLAATRQAGISSVACPHRELYSRNTPPGPLLLETSDDAHELREIVHHLYRTGPRPRHALPIVGFLTEDAAGQHPEVCWWEIDGHAALVTLICYRGGGLTDETLAQVVSLTRRLVEAHAGENPQPTQ